MARYVAVEEQEPEHLKWMRLAMEMVWYAMHRPRSSRLALPPLNRLGRRSIRS